MFKYLKLQMIEGQLSGRVTPDKITLMTFKKATPFVFKLQRPRFFFEIYEGVRK